MCLVSDVPGKINWYFYCAFSKLVSPGRELTHRWGAECLSRQRRRWAPLQEIWHLNFTRRWFENCTTKLSIVVLFFFLNYNYFLWQAEENAEQPSEELLAPTVERMLLRMEEIQVRGTHQWKVTVEPERSPVSGWVFVMSCYDSCGLLLHTDAASRPDCTVECVWRGSLSGGRRVYRTCFSVCLTAGSGGSEETVCFYHLFRPTLLGATRSIRYEDVTSFCI